MEESFREKVLSMVKKIPYGKVASYGQIALLADSPRVARQVGWVLHAYGEKNTPWWRVINSKGYISIKGAPALAYQQKEKLIEEGIVVEEDFTININKYRWITDF